MYAPLDFCKKMDISLTKPDTDLGRILRLLTETPDEVIKFLHTDSQFLNQNYNGRYVKLNQFVRKKEANLRKTLKLEGSLETEETKAYICDFFMTFLIVEVWKPDKEVSV